ncbi:MAG TPA: hypothetical protein VNG51_13945 [Ktedonobacteraceae bacterium]|nr:hypothetical protein [Ktedonobacteraceae bacterium]
MNEWNTSETERDERGNLEDRLSAYYGPTLPEQPLPPTSWVQLRSHLRRQHSLRQRFFHMPKRRRRVRFKHLPRVSYGGAIPVYIQDAFESIAHEAQLPYTADMLHCTFKKQIGIPSVRVSYWGKRKIRLILPAPLSRPLEPAELNVLLASGLASHVLRFERKPPYGLVRMLVIWACLVALLMLIPIGWQYFDAKIFPIAMMLFAILLCMVVLSHLKGRKFAFRVDALMVQWLGRSQVCQGLQALVRHSRHPQRKGFGQVSFAERIERVCGTRVAAQSERLTLVH